MSEPALTEACRAAIKWLRARGGSGVFDRNGVLLASGELAPFMRSTWNGLREARMATIEARRVTLTEAGRAVDCGITGVRAPVEWNREGRGEGHRQF